MYYSTSAGGHIHDHSGRRPRRADYDTIPVVTRHAAAVTMHHGHCCFDGNLTDYTKSPQPTRRCHVANAAGLLKESIWRDREFRALPRTAQATYAQLISQKELDRAGLQPLQVAKWAKGCTALTEADLWDDLDTLETHRFIFVDTDTDELFVRSYMRHCDITRYPNILKNALRCAGMVASEKLRHELATELRRLRKADADRVADAIEPAGHTPGNTNGTETNTNPSQTVPEPFQNGLTVPEPFSNPRDRDRDRDRDRTLVSTQVGEAPPKNQHDETPPEHCPKHPGGTDQPCGPCRRHREAHTAWNRQRETIVDTQRAATARAIRECTDCDDFGWALDDTSQPIEPATRCPQHDWTHAHA